MQANRAVEGDGVGGTGVDATAALLAAVFPGSHIGTRAYLEWLYERSPFGRVIETNVDDEAGRAAHYALVPVRLYRDGQPLDAALSLNTAVSERARGGGIFVRLASETIAAAARQGVDAVVGIANANSTPGFVRRLGFTLLAPLPATVTLPRPGATAGIRSGVVDGTAFADGGLAADADALLAPPTRGLARSWTAETLRWRLERPEARYALHRGTDLLAVSCLDARHGVRVAILLKVFASEALSRARTRALVRACCRFHRAPLGLHVGFNERVAIRGLPLPRRLRESPLNLIYRDIGAERALMDAGAATGFEGNAGPGEPPPPSVSSFEFLDFDAY